jgi:hypothetical protein
VNINEFLANKIEHKRELSELKFLEMLREHARNSHSVIKHSPMYLQDDAKANFFVIRPKDGAGEKSPFWIDRVVEGLSNWKTYPDRKHCVRGYNMLDRIGNSGEAYVVIPFDNSRVGICPAASFYRSFKEFGKFKIERLDNSGLAKWISLLAEGLNACDPELKVKVKEPDTFNEFKKALNTLDVKVSKNKLSLAKKLRECEDISDEAKLVLKDLLDRYVTNVEGYLDEKLDPHANGFAAVRIDGLARSNEDLELWTDAPCLLIRRDTYVELYKKGSIK